MDDIARHDFVRSLAEARLGGDLDLFESPLTVLASPAWRGVEADIWVAGKNGRTEVYKHYHPDTFHYVDTACAIDAAEAAGAAGVGPRVLEAWKEDAVFVMEHLGAGWKAGGLHHTYSKTVRDEVIRAKKRFQRTEGLKRRGDIFVEIRSLHELCVARGARLPKNIDAFMDFAYRAEQAMSGLSVDQVACHRDGNTANIMIGPNNKIMLLDYDLAANSDPYEDIGCHLAEFFEREDQAREGYLEWTGSFEEGLYQRASVYGTVDDLRWGLIAASLAAASPRKSLDFTKYSAWRLLRYEIRSQNSTAADRLRKMS